MKKVLIYCLAVSTLFFISCNKDRITGSGAILTEERAVNNFTKIHTSGATNVYVTQGANFKVEVKGYENLMPHFETGVNNSTLEVGYKNVNVRNDNIEVFVTLPVLTGLSITGSGNINTAGNFAGNTDFETNISGSGNITISEGTTQNYVSSITGSGNINAFGLIAQNGDISIEGSGNSEVNALTDLKVRISGSGNVYYKNNPVISSLHISGSGSLIHK